MRLVKHRLNIAKWACKVREYWVFALVFVDPPYWIGCNIEKENLFIFTLLFELAINNNKIHGIITEPEDTETEFPCRKIKFNNNYDSNSCISYSFLRVPFTNKIRFFFFIRFCVCYVHQTMKWSRRSLWTPRLAVYTRPKWARMTFSFMCIRIMAPVAIGAPSWCFSHWWLFCWDSSGSFC